MSIIKYSLPKAIKYAKEDIDMSGGDGEHLNAEFYVHNPEYNPEVYEDAKVPSDRVFNSWLNEYLGRMIDNSRREIEYAMEEVNGEWVVPIWRVITAPKNWTPDFKSDEVSGLGVYWSWDKKAAEAHWGKSCPGCVKWRIGSMARKSQVDWNVTLALNVHPSLGEDEKEIRLKEGSEIPILSLERSNDTWGRSFEEVPVQTYTGRKFAANPRKR